jgi:hypothetical protein
VTGRLWQKERGSDEDESGRPDDDEPDEEQPRGEPGPGDAGAVRNEPDTLQRRRSEAAARRRGASDPRGGTSASRGGASDPRNPAPGNPAADAPYAYLIYPHKPIVAYVPKSGRLLSEYCVEFPDLTGAISQTRLPDSDDVLAKWMALTGDEERLIRNANMHLPGRQVDPNRVRRDLWRLSEWERQRRGYGPVRAPRT